MKLKEHKALLVLLSAFLIIKIIFLLSTYHLATWDEAVYLGMGKHIYSMGTSGLWEPFRPLGLPLIIGIFWKVGADYIKLAELASVIFATGTITLTYLIAEFVFGKKTAILSALLIATFPVFFAYSSFILSDIPAVFFFLLAIYLYLKGKLAWAGISTAAAVMFKFTQVLIALAFIFVLLHEIYKRKDHKSGKKYILGFLAGLLPYFILNYILYRNEWPFPDAVFKPFILASWHQYNPAESLAIIDISSWLNNAFFYLIVLAKNNFILLFFIIGIFIALKKRENSHTLPVLCITLLLGYFTLISNKQERFILLIIPFIAILAALAITRIMQEYRAYSSILLILLCISSISVSAQDFTYYSKRSASAPEILELYTYPNDKDLAEPILSSDPVFAAYTDKKIIPYYFSAAEGIKTYGEFERATIILRPDSFYCRTTDTACLQDKEELLSKIQNTSLIYEGQFYGKDYYIYSKK